MTLDQANRILNAARDGDNVSQASINHALMATGDIPALSPAERTHESKIAKRALAKRKRRVIAGAAAVMTEVRAGRQVDPHRAQWARSVMSAQRTKT